MKVTLAQKVRLWFAGGCQAVALLYIFLIMALPDYTSSAFPGLLITRASLNGYIGGLLVFQAAAVILASISLYRFVKPSQPAPPAVQPQSGYWAPGPPPPPWPYAPPPQPGQRQPQDGFWAPGPPPWPYATPPQPAQPSAPGRG